jgi:hypothetical protein
MCALSLSRVLSSAALTAVFLVTPTSNGWGFKPPIHQNVSLNALAPIVVSTAEESFRFRPRAVVEVMLANAATDDWGPGGGFWAPQNHFDNELLPSSSRRVLNLREEIVGLITSDPPNGAVARQRLGTAFHSIQDFYAHSNWVELFEANVPNDDRDPLGGFNRAMGRRVMAQPPLSTSFCDFVPGIIFDDTNLLPTVTTLTTGYFDLPEFCDNLPAGKCFHGAGSCGGINKDTPDVAGHARALQLATAASTDFVNQILEDPRVANGGPEGGLNVKAVKALMGISGAPPLAFVIDTTGSMSDDIFGVQTRVKTMIEERRATEQEPESYVLVGFNDPSVGPVVKTSDPAIFLNAVDSLGASGGGDCPEPSVGAMRRAVELLDYESSLFLFTDADASDASLRGALLSESTAKNVEITAFVTGACSGRRGIAAADLYDGIATATGGLIFFIDKDEVGSALDVVDAALSNDLVDVLAVRTTLENIETGERRDGRLYRPDSTHRGLSRPRIGNHRRCIGIHRDNLRRECGFSIGRRLRDGCRRRVAA